MNQLLSRDLTKGQGGSTRYRMYYERTLALCKSIRFYAKHYAMANSGQLTDESIHIYHTHLTGEYAVGEEQMVYMNQVVTKERVELETDLYRGFQNKEGVFLKLLAKYPKYETLLYGMSNPLTTERISELSNGEIIHYDGQYVDPEEYTLIDELSGYIGRYLCHWNLPSYQVTDRHYLSMMTSILYLNLLTEIFAIRLSLTHTHVVHSFHLNEFLRSRGISEGLLSELNGEQKYFLYRNINWIRKHTGQKQTLAFVEQGLLNPIGLSLQSYQFYKNINSGGYYLRGKETYPLETFYRMFPETEGHTLPTQGPTNYLQLDGEETPTNIRHQRFFYTIQAWAYISNLQANRESYYEFQWFYHLHRKMLGYTDETLPCDLTISLTPGISNLNAFTGLRDDFIVSGLSDTDADRLVAKLDHILSHNQLDDGLFISKQVDRSYQSYLLFITELGRQTNTFVRKRLHILLKQVYPANTLVHLKAGGVSVSDWMSSQDLTYPEDVLGEMSSLIAKNTGYNPGDKDTLRRYLESYLNDITTTQTQILPSSTTNAIVALNDVHGYLS